MAVYSCDGSKHAKGIAITARSRHRGLRGCNLAKCACNLQCGVPGVISADCRAALSSAALKNCLHYFENLRNFFDELF